MRISNEPTLTLVNLRPPLLNDELVEAQFLGGTLEHTFLNRILTRRQLTSVNLHNKCTHLCDKPEYIDLLRLSDTMRTIHSLKIGLGIPNACTAE